MYRIWLVNFVRYSQHEFATESEAVEYAKSISSECRIEKDNVPIGFCSHNGGYRRYTPTRLAAIIADTSQYLAEQYADAEHVAMTMMGYHRNIISACELDALHADMMKMIKALDATLQEASADQAIIFEWTPDWRRALEEIQKAAKMRPNEFSFEWRDVPDDVDEIPDDELEYWIALMADWA